MQDLIYFVNNNDIPTGETADKLTAHTDETRLHAAFSCYIFNAKGEFLVTKRASTKKVWPNVWTNSCCGHPMPNESREDAITRRAEYELGLNLEKIMLVVPDYTYKTPPYNGIIEHEYCPIFTAIAQNEPKPNPSEVADFKWVSWEWFLEQIKQDPDDYSHPLDENAPVWSWWCKDQQKYLSGSPAFTAFIDKL
jgi:isopentenyl-diphosphate delta-isomerase